MTNNELLYWLLSIWFKSITLSLILGFIMCFVCYLKCKLSNTNRWHWFEVHDTNWCPNVFKEYLRRILYELIWKGYLYGGKSSASIILPLIKKHNISLILDLCSGNCGPSTIINESINDESESKDVITILTDLYPQISSWKVFADSNKNILYSLKPIDATNIDENEIKKVLNDCNKHLNESNIARTIFGAFHHFEPNLCIKIFEDCFKHNDIMIIGDGFPNRSLVDFIVFALLFIILLPFGTVKCIYFWLFEDNDSYLMKRIFYCIFVVVFYAVFLFIFIHDSVVSLARFWSEEELKEMSKTALNNINANKETKIKYECKCIQMETKDIIPVKEKRLQPGFMPKYCFSVFVCIPN